MPRRPGSPRASSAPAAPVPPVEAPARSPGARERPRGASRGCAGALAGSLWTPPARAHPRRGHAPRPPPRRQRPARSDHRHRRRDSRRNVDVEDHRGESAVRLHRDVAHGSTGRLRRLDPLDRSRCRSRQGGLDSRGDGHRALLGSQPSSRSAGCRLPRRGALVEGTEPGLALRTAVIVSAQRRGRRGGRGGGRDRGFEGGGGNGRHSGPRNRDRDGRRHDGRASSQPDASGGAKHAPER